MSSIQIRDLPHRAAMDGAAMSAVRGGGALGPNVNVNVALDQQFAQFQQIGVNVLNNNGVIGSALAGPDMQLAAEQWKQHRALAPAL